MYVNIPRCFEQILPPPASTCHWLQVPVCSSSATRAPSLTMTKCRCRPVPGAFKNFLSHSQACFGSVLLHVLVITCCHFATLFGCLRHFPVRTFRINPSLVQRHTWFCALGLQGLAVTAGLSGAAMHLLVAALKILNSKIHHKNIMIMKSRALIGYWTRWKNVGNLRSFAS